MSIAFSLLLVVVFLISLLVWLAGAIDVYFGNRTDGTFLIAVQVWVIGTIFVLVFWLLAVFV